MDERRLRELLRRADEGGAVADVPDVAAGVLRRRARQDRVRRVGMGVAAVVFVGGLVGMWDWGRPVTQRGEVAGRAAVVSDRAEVERLGREAEAYLAVARRAEAVDRLRRAEGEAARLRAVADAERERAATVMVSQGDWRRKQGGSGAEEYRRAAELFDGTRAAAEARARLQGQG